MVDDTVTVKGSPVRSLQKFIERELNPQQRDEILRNVPKEFADRMRGSIARAGDDPKLHAHVILGRRDASTVGGHLVRGTVRPTLEVFVTDLGMRLARARDVSTGLWLLT